MTISSILYILASFIIILIVWIGLLEYRLKKFFAGTNAKNLEEVMATLGKQVIELREIQKNTQKH